MSHTTLAAARHNSDRRAPDDESKFNADGQLVELVAKALRDTGHSALRTLEIEVSAGVIVLWGRVPNYYEKQVAQEAAQKVAGVRGIANGIDVVCCR